MDASPGYPRPNPSLSFWLQHTRNSPLLGHRTTDALPDKTDATIIGSGLSGAATAYFLLTAGPEDKRPKSVALLEAREACDGATARNGGHCRPDCYRGAANSHPFRYKRADWGRSADYTHYKANFGREQALKVIQNEMDTLNLMEEIIAKEGIDCDFWRGFTYDVAMDQSAADSLAASYADFIADGGPVEGIVTPILDPAEAREATRCPAATAAYKSPAGSLFPRKLVLHLLTLCVKKYGLNLQTRTPVRRVMPRTHNIGDTRESGARAGGWRVETDRGAVETETVVYATNAYTATLLPEFAGHIWPFKGQCAAAVPPEAYAGPNMLRETYGLAPSDYLIQRPSDGVIIFGGQRKSVPVERLLGNTDDARVDPEMAAALREALPRYLEGWGENSDLAVGEGLVHVWSGIMGYTTEGIPYVGELHDKPGAFICAGHHGHGMARVMTCARGLAALIQGSSWESTGLPECFQPTRERLARPKQVVTHDIGKQEVIGRAESEA
ncbi:FAD dependent oxidoreductase [Mycena albidolilacea]|uniref:FAD dependent oxidoreductase n=1 Tax=Mycena albidolilacea TaxID=1033008 RepID=A0AAD7ABP0_9AGAR|nr:FAD dependent oxidoreductase [Mycena albidolilacea]